MPDIYKFQKLPLDGSGKYNTFKQMKNALTVIILLFSIHVFKAQNSKIKCYFNHPVNTSLSSGVNAQYNTSFKDTLIGYINRSKYSLDFCVYNYTYNSGDGFNAIATAVNNAYARGVVIRWIYDGSSTNSGLSLLNSNIHTLGSPTTSAYGICHNKFVVIDANSANSSDAFVWTGSFNFSQAQNSTDYNNVIIFQDKPMAQAYYAEFNQMWGGTASTPNLSNSKFGTYKSPSAQNNFTVNGTPVQVYFSPKDNATSHLQNAVNTANFELFFGIYTFTDNNIATVIKNRILAGVFSKGIEDSFSQSYSPYTTLSSTMGSNFIVYSGTGLYHNKMLIVDPMHASSDPLVGTGSYNWSSSATNSNDENLVIVHNAVVANQYYQSFCQNFADFGGSACSAPTGIQDYDPGSKTITVYPTVTGNEITVDIKSGSKTWEIQVLNTFGQLLSGYKISDTVVSKVSLSSLPVGCYYIRVLNGAEVTVHKIIKQ